MKMATVDRATWGERPARTRDEWRAQSYKERWEDGYFYYPWTPYSCRESLRLKRALCNALGTHTPARDGSWSFGSSVCGLCRMTYDAWPQETIQRACDRLNEMQSDKQQMAAAHMIGGGPPWYRP